MQRYDSMTHILMDAREQQREIRFIDGEKDESIITFGDLWHRSIGLLGALQARGMRAGDELVVFTRSNEKFVIAFWAAILGGIVPVPVAGQGLKRPRHFLQFRALATYQGLAFIPLSDGLAVEADDSGVVVRDAAGLLVSPGADRDRKLRANNDFESG